MCICSYVIGVRITAYVITRVADSGDFKQTNINLHSHIHIRHFCVILTFSIGTQILKISPKIVNLIEIWQINNRFNILDISSSSHSQNLVPTMYILSDSPYIQQHNTVRY